jgi:hypothetical protein
MLTYSSKLKWMNSHNYNKLDKTLMLKLLNGMTTLVIMKDLDYPLKDKMLEPIKEMLDKNY